MQKIDQQVGKSRAVCGLSGGVDSSVAAVLVSKAIGDRLTCIFVDNGLLRLGEAQEVVRMFRDHFHLNLVHVDAAERFLSRLEGITDPEQKRKIIGNVFVDVFDEEAAKLEDARFLVQGTLYPDVVESVSFKGGPSVVIKTHHNVGGLPEKMKMALVEPLRELFKDEVREVGATPDAAARAVAAAVPGRARHSCSRGHRLQAPHPGEPTPSSIRGREAWTVERSASSACYCRCSRSA